MNAPFSQSRPTLPFLPKNPLPFSEGQVKTWVGAEKLTVGVNTVTDLINITGKGYVTEIQVIMNNLSAAGDSWLRVYVDGESTPSIDMDFGMFCAHYLHTHISNEETVTSNPNEPQLVSDKLIVEGGTNFKGNSQYRSYNIRFTIPYQTSIQITHTCKGAGTDIWSTVTYVDGVSLPWKLKSSCRKWVDRLTGQTPTQQGDRTIKFLDLASGAGNRGYIAALFLVGVGSSSPDWLENNWVAYLDGLTPGAGVRPQYDSSGGEDAAKSAFYFLRTPQASNYHMAFKHSSNLGATCMVDYMGLHGGIKFNDGVLFCMESGIHASSTTPTANLNIGWSCLYYVPV